MPSFENLLLLIHELGIQYCSEFFCLVRFPHAMKFGIVSQATMVEVNDSKTEFEILILELQTSGTLSWANSP
jgi:hypothetical protein